MQLFAFKVIVMFLGISEAITAIMDAINEALGPISNPTQMGMYVRDILIQLLATIILFLVVKFLFWNKVTAFLEAKRAEVDSSLETANKAKENALELEAKMNLEMSLAKDKIKKLLDDAEREGNQKREDIINEAKEEAARRYKMLEEELATEKANMANQIKQEIIEIAFAAAEKIVNKEIDQDKYLDVIDEILKETK